MRIIILVSLVLHAASPAVAEEPVDYLRDIKPVLKERCYACHGALKQEAGLRLDTAALIGKGSENGKVLQKGRPAESELISRVSEQEESLRMPPEGKPLSTEEIAKLTLWIEQGMPAPAEEQPETDPRQHWAFLTPVKSPIPQVKRNGWQTNPVDAFVAASQERLKLSPVPPVQKSLWLRRVSLDLIGLPPTQQELTDYLNDSSVDAERRVVDRLLASPHYGERWGRHFMDVWRYTDWYGLGAQLRNSQKHLWHWRDWIIESLNEDKGYDQMVREMLAADELYPQDQDKLRATGFLARNYYLFNRTTWLDSTIEHTSKAFLGLTINCAKCHDHKYDPLTHDDYYQLRAFFEPHQVRLDPVPGELDLEKNGLPRVFDAHLEEPTYLHVRGDEKNPDKSRVLRPDFPEVLRFKTLELKPVPLPPEAYRPALREFVLKTQLSKADKERKTAKEQLSKAETELAVLQNKEKQAPAEVTTPSMTGQVFLQDGFEMARPKLWETPTGKWSYEKGVLTAKQPEAVRAAMRTRQHHPQNFQATLKFKTIGGNKWRSVGLAFDAIAGREKTVYLSAVQPGSKVQFSYNAGASSVYPPAGKQDRPVQLNTDYTLTMFVRDQLVNVSINGEHALAYVMPIKRETGHLELMAFDVEVEFDSLEVRELPTNVELKPADSTPAKPATAPQTVAQAELKLQIAKLGITLAERRRAKVLAVYRAETAKYQPTLPKNLQELIDTANEADRQQLLIEAEKRVVENRLALETAADRKKAQVTLTANEKKLEQAREAVTNRTGEYQPLRVSRKALEGPAEKADSRNAPYPKLSTGRRTALAQWMVDRRNPLTARVVVNHVWLRHFGQPLVDPVTDFGRRTAAPVQQNLLDWLAVDLMEQEWSLKHLHRRIVLSETYRLGTGIPSTHENEQKSDAVNAHYWRRLPSRMESDVVRDSLLHLAGVLNTTQGGPTIAIQEKSSRRRSLYFTHSRDSKHAFLTMFDHADILRCYRRASSIVPQQALTLANSEFSLQMSKLIADRIAQNVGDDAEFTIQAWILLLGRVPTDAEQQVCLQTLTQLQTLFTRQKRADAVARSRANLVRSLLNHNDFITIR